MIDVMLDMDGVLIDNTNFEREVTLDIVRRLAETRNVTIETADRLWHDQLKIDARSPHWYDYDFHCARLALPPLSRQSHMNHVQDLSEIDGARETIDLLRSDPRFRLWVVSDAMRWVVRFKLDSTSLSDGVNIVSSDELGAPKNANAFWEGMRSHGANLKKSVFVDNRMDNLLACAATHSEIQLVHFEFDEHVTGLVDGPQLRSHLESQENGPNRIVAVADHHALRLALYDLAASMQDGNLETPIHDEPDPIG